MPYLEKGTECIRTLLLRVSKDMYSPLFPTLFPLLGAQISVEKKQHSDSFGRYFVAKWLISWSKMGVTRAKKGLLSVPKTYIGRAGWGLIGAQY